MSRIVNLLTRQAGFAVTAWVLVLSMQVDLFAQEMETGFYIVMDSKKNCPNPVHGRNETLIYCLTKEPILTVSDFESVSDVKYDSLLELRYLLLRLTPGGYNTLKVLMEKLPDTRLALVIENTVAGTYNHPSKILSRSLPIRGGIDANEIDWIYSALKKLKP